MVVPSLAADDRLQECVRSLEAQSLRGIEIIVVDNSGAGRARERLGTRVGVRILENRHNAGFGAAVNRGFRESESDYLATLNDDATASPDWLAALIVALDAEPLAGMAASRVLLAGEGKLDSTGMLIARDGSSKQRGHGAPPERFSRPDEALLPSGSAAIYRREMLDEIGLFDESFFLYCEDTDLGLRARRAGWRCLYVPGAVVEHLYSYSAGRASARKAWLVERNRLRTVTRNFPASWLAASFGYSLCRYLWHIVSIFRGEGKAAEFSAAGEPAWKLAWYVLKAHWNLVRELSRLWKERAAIRKTGAMTDGEFAGLLRKHSISVREVAAL